MVDGGGLGHASSPSLTLSSLLLIWDVGKHFRHKWEKISCPSACGTNFIHPCHPAIYSGLTVCQMYKLVYLYHLSLGDRWGWCYCSHFADEELEAVSPWGGQVACPRPHRAGEGAAGFQTRSAWLQSLWIHLARVTSAPWTSMHTYTCIFSLLCWGRRGT